MNFADLYTNNRLAVFNALKSMWAYEGQGESQKDYLKQMETLLGDLFAPENAVPLVQCMNFYKSVPESESEAAKALVEPLWGKPFTPFEHQYECWKTLLNGYIMDSEGNKRPKSMCVTTGTGSGKTECFMMPLIKDLMNDRHRELVSPSGVKAMSGVKAIFLYPLNALMDDQQQRLEELIAESGCDIKYAVYNGNLPDEDVDPTDESEHAKKVRRQIEAIRGIDKNGNIKYPHALWTRKQVRETPPEILLTNPTMLEFILLRDTDKPIIATADLRWFVIDETHTYTGAAAAELAMTLRRVVIAFNKDARDIRFATSSATFGNFGDVKDEKELARLQKEADDALRKFISDITGTSVEQIDIINGERRGIKEYPDNSDKIYWEKICLADFCTLEEIFPEGKDTEECLRLLDELCDREERRYLDSGEKIPAMKAKVHYFYRVPNKGIFANLSQLNGASFQLEDKSGHASVSGLPLIEVGRCGKCGEFLAIGMTEKDVANPGYKNLYPIKHDEQDIFETELYEDSSSSGKQMMVFATSNEPTQMGDDNKAYIAVGDKLKIAMPGEIPTGQWHIIGNDKHYCPHCHEKLTKKKSSQNDETEPDDDRVRKFHVSAEFISRLIAPSVLNQLQTGDISKVAKGRDVTEEEIVMLHDGQQYISFVDSRQGAARGSLAQNMEQERRWVYTMIYDALRRRALEGQDEISKKCAKLETLNPETDEYDELEFEIRKLRRKLKGGNKSLVWKEIFTLLYEDPRSRTFANVFVKHTENSNEIDDDGEVTDEALRRYIYSLMVEHLAYRPATDASPETMGLFRMSYPALERIDSLPPAVDRYNTLLSEETSRITLNDWKNLLNVYLDFTVRNNQSLFLNMPDEPAIDIEATNRYSSKKPSRKPFNAPVMKEGEIAMNRVAIYLTDLLMKEKAGTFADLQTRYFKEIADVIAAMSEDMVRNEYGILKPGTRYDVKKNKEKQLVDDDGYRLNLNDVSFVLYEDVALCDVKAGSGEHHLPAFRPIGVTFKNYSPYTRGTRCVEIPKEYRAKWSPLPVKETSYSLEEIRNWACNERALLWNHGVWGEAGIFADRLNKIHTDFPIFIQAEHTAQVAKGVAKRLQRDFKDHLINILACSTTMEMGVDLGDLEMVMLASVPPMPANYKQRSGRSGRNQKVKSACITLCGSDAIGLRTLKDPLASLIQRAVDMPTVDLQSPQLIQRHINAFFVRAFNVFGNGNGIGKLSTSVLDYYTRFRIVKDGMKRIIAYDNGDPAAIGMGDEGINFELFNTCCITPSEVEKYSDELCQLLKGTIFSSKTPMQVALAAKQENEKCYEVLRDKVSEIRDVFDNTTNDKFQNYLRIKFRVILMQRLLDFWAAQRFIPNANMPVSVIDFDLVNANSDYYSPGGESNPTYTMSQALTQYAPGRKVAIDGVAHVVGGVLSTNTLKQENAYMTIYHDTSRTTIDSTTGMTEKDIIPWPVNGQPGLTLIQPLSFLPDLEADASRQIDDRVFAQVEAQLIGTQNWADESYEPHLFQVRTNKTGDGSILYYIKGEGFGYCHCMRCGRTVVEHGVAKEDSPYPDNFNPNKVEDKNGNIRFKHHALSGKNYGKYCECPRSAVKRNVIIGDTMPTDFAEIRVRHKNDSKWVNRPENWTLTLAIVLTNAFAEYEGINRDALGFATMHNGHIVIFDSNPGGAGYSLKLFDIPTFIEVLKVAKNHIEKAIQNNAIDMLLDKFTIRFLSDLKPQMALDWINSELLSKDVLPIEVKNSYPDSVMTSWKELARAIEQSHDEVNLFVSPYYIASELQGEYSNWNYDDDNHSWLAGFRDILLSGSSRTIMNIVLNPGDKLPIGIISTMSRLKGWIKDVRLAEQDSVNGKLRPIAYVNGSFYFTNDQSLAQLNNQWASGTLYRVKVKRLDFSYSEIDFSEKPNTEIFLLRGQATAKIKSTELAEVVRNHSEGIIDRFIQLAKSKDKDIEICYQDKYLRTPLGIFVVLQIMDFLVSRIGKNFKISFRLEEFFDDNRRGSIESSLGSSSERDRFLLDQLRNFIYQKSIDDALSGSYEEEISYPKRVLPHWRELTIKCGNDVLRIMPDGGFINGWRLDGKPWEWKVDELDYTSEIPMFRSEIIRYTIALENA